MKSCLASLVALGVGLSACGGPRGPHPAELDPLVERSAPRPPLPDDIERAVSRLAALALADQPDTAALVLDLIQQSETERERQGLLATGLLDNAMDLQNTLEPARAYLELAEQLLAEGDPDPVLRRRLEHHLETQPLNLAARRLKEDRTRKVGAVFNRMVAPVSHFFLGGVFPAIETGRAAIASLLVMHSFPEATTQERQALRAYQEYLARNPGAPERFWVEKQITRYERKIRQHLFREALTVAERALDAHRPDAALAHLDRAERLRPDTHESATLRQRALAQRRERDAAIRSSLKAAALIGIPLPAESAAALARLTYAALEAPTEELARQVSAWQDGQDPGLLSDEVEFLQAQVQLEHYDEHAFFRAMERLAKSDPAYSNMARYARWIVTDPEQNPYAAYRAARSADRNQRVRWLLLGRHARGAQRRGLWRPLEWVLDSPGFVISIATLPLRTLQYPAARARFGGGVIDAGERYVARFPSGAHAAELHRELERRYAQREYWSQALEHLRAQANPNPARIQVFREKLALRTLKAARLQRRLDVRASLYRLLLEEYADTSAAELARSEFRDLVADASPQRIRISKQFLLENRELWGPKGLGLRRELLDEDSANGEIAEEGITLIGRTFVRIALEERDPTIKEVPPRRFARFIAALEEASYRQLFANSKERPTPDPQRDLFFERARLGLLDSADVRPSARSEAEFLSTKEKYGSVRRRESILPVEVLLQGGLEDFGVAAFPRIRLPGESPDAFLYR